MKELLKKLSFSQAYKIEYYDNYFNKWMLCEYQEYKEINKNHLYTISYNLDLYKNVRLFLYDAKHNEIFGTEILRVV
jgi:hypothetical protein